jgi:putative membrane protein
VTTSFLPTLNASLNAFSGLCLIAGYLFIRQKHRIAHRNCMVAALVASTLFLISYIVYHYTSGIKYFKGPPLARHVYLLILFSHTPLAVAILPLAVVTLTFAVRGRFESHKRIARWTWPIWIYVSVTGVIIYFMLYVWFPSP